MEWGFISGAAGLVVAAITAIVAWRKTGPTNTSILVDAAQDVVLIQRGELDRLNTLLNTIRNELAEANARAWRAEQRAVELEARVRHLEENGGGNG
jgi:hypothetical protein